MFDLKTGLRELMFPFPLEATGGSCRKSISGKMALPRAFPSPLEVNGGSYPKGRDKDLDILVFPYPPDETGGSDRNQVLG